MASEVGREQILSLLIKDDRPSLSTLDSILEFQGVVGDEPITCRAFSKFLHPKVPLELITSQPENKDHQADRQTEHPP